MRTAVMVDSNGEFVLILEETIERSAEKRHGKRKIDSDACIPMALTHWTHVWFL